MYSRSDCVGLGINIDGRLLYYLWYKIALLLDRSYFSVVLGSPYSCLLFDWFFCALCNFSCVLGILFGITLFGSF